MRLDEWLKQTGVAGRPEGDAGLFVVHIGRDRDDAQLLHDLSDYEVFNQLPYMTTLRQRQPGEEMYLDREHGIIAAGAVVIVNCGHGGQKFVRAVMIWRKSKIGKQPQGHYRIATQVLNDSGRHLKLEAENGEATFRLTQKMFFQRLAEIAELGTGYHDNG